MMAFLKYYCCCLCCPLVSLVHEQYDNKKDNNDYDDDDDDDDDDDNITSKTDHSISLKGYKRVTGNNVGDDISNHNIVNNGKKGGTGVVNIIGTISFNITTTTSSDDEYFEEGSISSIIKDNFSLMNENDNVLTPEEEEIIGKKHERNDEKVGENVNEECGQISIDPIDTIKTIEDLMIEQIRKEKLKRSTELSMHYLNSARLKKHHLDQDLKLGIVSKDEFLIYSFDILNLYLHVIRFSPRDLRIIFIVEYNKTKRRFLHIEKKYNERIIQQQQSINNESLY